MKSTSDIALLFFARSPYGDTKRRRFSNNKLHLEVVSHLHFKTYRNLCDSGLPVIVSNEHTQKSQSLATNLCQAISEVFQIGFQKVIVVGNDCPDLDQHTLERAIQSLREGKNVLGPDMKGGNYLIGIDKSEFCEDTFENELRVRSNVHENLSVLLQKCNAPLVVLCAKRDINSPNTLWEYVRSSVKSSTANTFLSRLCFSFIHFVKVKTCYIQTNYAPVFSSDHSRRGPPICI